MAISRTIPRRCAAFALALLLSAPPATLSAADAPPKEAPAATACADFKWPLDKEQQAFAGAGIETVASGSARGGWKEQAFALTLQPEADVPYTLPPARRKREGEGPRFGGIVAFAAPDKAATYQVTLSTEGWVDIIEQGAALKPTEHFSAKGCPGLRKSLRFAVGAVPLVLQISGVPEQSIKVAIRPAE